MCVCVAVRIKRMGCQWGLERADGWGPCVDGGVGRALAHRTLTFRVVGGAWSVVLGKGSRARKYSFRGAGEAGDWEK